MSYLDRVKQIIINTYNEDKDFLKNLEKPAKKQIDPFFLEFYKELDQHGEEIVKNIQMAEKIQVENSVRETEIEKEEVKIDDKIIESIKESILSILNFINFNLYKNQINLVKKFIILDVFEKYQDEFINEGEINEEIKEKLVLFISQTIDEEVQDYQSKLKYRREELLKNTINDINPQVEDFFKTHSKEKLEKMTLFQKQNLIKYFLESIFEKQIKLQLLNNKINHKDYEFLTKNVRTYFINRYKRHFEGIS